MNTADAAAVGAKRERAESPGCDRAPARVRFSPEVQVQAAPEEPPLVGLRANDVITLRFRGLGGEVLDVRPTFTHQLFDEEMMMLAEPSAPSVTVEIDMRSLAHRVHMEGLSEEDRAEVLSRLRPALPAAPLPSAAVRGETLGCFENRGDAFEVVLVTHKSDGACELVSACEKMAMWFIETADAVDFKDDRWEALLLYKRHSELQAAELVGYVTLYTFQNPVMGAKVRICQALVLPGFQQRGMGRALVRAAYDLCRRRGAVSEVTVEDPAEGFQRLRDAVDVEWYLEHCSDSSPLRGYRPCSGRLSRDLFSPALEVDSCARHLKITKAQTEFVIDALQYFLVEGGAEEDKDGWQRPEAEEGGEVSAVPDLKRWRPDVKRRLLKRLPELRLVPKAEMQRGLEEAFREHLQRITAAGRSAGVRGRVHGLKLAPPVAQPAAVAAQEASTHVQ